MPSEDVTLPLDLGRRGAAAVKGTDCHPGPLFCFFFVFFSFFLAVRLFVKCVHQLESVAIRLT